MPQPRPLKQTQTHSVVVPRGIIHTEWRGASVTLTPAHRLRSTHPLVRALGPDQFKAERAGLDFEDLA